MVFTKVQRFGLLLLVVGLMFFSVPIAMAQTGDGQIYVVQADDTLWKVAEKYLGDGHRFDEIVAATQAKHAGDASFAAITDPGLIYSGSKLWIPAGSVVQSAGQTPAAAAPQSAPSSDTDAAASETSAPPVSISEKINGHIAFSFWNNASNRCTYEINVIDVEACLAGPEACQANRRIFALNNVSEPALSPDGTRLAFRGWGGIPEKHRENSLDHPYYGCSAQPQAERRLGHTALDATDYTGAGIYYEDSHPDWSPDGQRLLFDSSREGDGITRIILIGADGLYEEQLRIAGQQPSWAPDNERFVYRGCDQTGNRCGLWLAKAIPVQSWDVGLNLIGPLLAESEAAHPDWSPVGEQIVYQSPINGSWDLFIINADGSNKRQLTGDSGLEGLPVWSPDGQWVAYLSNANGNWGIWLIPAIGGEPQLLFSFDGGSFTPQSVTPYFTRDWIDEQLSWSR